MCHILPFSAKLKIQINMQINIFKYKTAPSLQLSALFVFMFNFLVFLFNTKNIKNLTVPFCWPSKYLWLLLGLSIIHRARFFVASMGFPKDTTDRIRFLVYLVSKNLVRCYLHKVTGILIDLHTNQTKTPITQVFHSWQTHTHTCMYGFVWSVSKTWLEPLVVDLTLVIKMGK